MTGTTLSTYFAYYITVITPGLLLWKDRYNEDLLEDNKINVQAKYYTKSIKSPIRNILNKNKEEILYSDIKFKVLLVIYKEVIQSKNVRGYHSKVIIDTNFPTIRAVYIAVSNKILNLFTS